MDRILAVLCFVMALGVSYLAFPDGVVATLFCTILAFMAIVLIRRTIGKESTEEFLFLRRIFIIGLLLRVLLASITYIFRLQAFFGGDSITYDITGYWIMQSWMGNLAAGSLIEVNLVGFNWGMSYVVACIYMILGRNSLAIQLFNCVVGAVTAPLIYYCAMQLFNNKRVARISAYFIVFYPSLITWTSQGLKDGLIVFLIVLAMNSVLLLQKKFDYIQFTLLIICVSGIFALRFYIFFALMAAVVGSFVIGTHNSIISVIRRVAVLVVAASVLTYFGVIENARQQAQVFDLERLQASRFDQARSAESGFGEDIDVSTTEGMLQALPLGFTYSMFAPFPWEIENFRQAITLPEMIIWWSSIPLLVYGLWYTLKNRLRKAFAVLIFTLLLTGAYSIFQGNVGTAYRMRAQLQVFYFMFVSVGVVLYQEKRENHKLIGNLRKRQPVANKRAQTVIGAQTVKNI